MWCKTSQQEIPAALAAISRDEQTELSDYNLPHNHATCILPCRECEIKPAASHTKIESIDSSSRGSHQPHAQFNSPVIPTAWPNELAEESSTTHHPSAVDMASRPSLSLQSRIERIDKIHRQIEQERMSRVTDSTQGVGAPGLMTGFFVVLFLFGQSVSTWAFISSHFTAWICGIGFSLLGITFALFCLLFQIDAQRNDIALLKRELAEMKNSSRPSRAPTPFSGPKI